VKKFNNLIIHPSTVFSASWLGLVSHAGVFRGARISSKRLRGRLDWDHLAKIRQHDWKEPRKISKVAKFENDLLNTNEDITSQSREILQMFVWWGASSCPPVTNVCKISRLCRAIFSLSFDVSPLNLVISNFKVLDGYSLTALYQKLRKKVNHESVYWPYQARTQRTRTCMSVINHFLTHFVLLSDREAIIVWPLKVWTLEETCA